MDELKPFGVQLKKPDKDTWVAPCVATGKTADPWDGSLSNVGESDIGKGDWAVMLPHSCDSWVIAAGSREHTLAEARRFRDELDKAIAMLEAGE